MTTYYIDPVSGNNANDGLSTGAPKLTVPTPTANNTYLLKCGTTYKASVTIGAAGVILSSYGSGAKPIINPGFVDRWSVRIGSACTGASVLNLELTGALGNGAQACFGVYIGSAPGSGSDSVKIKNCYIHNITANAAGDCTGVTGFGNDIEVSNCVIKDIPDDAIWIEGLRAKILYNQISNVGTDSSATGDCIQLNGETASTSAGAFQVIGNVMNHSANLEKQCFIVSGASLGSGGLVADNIAVFPEDPTGLGGNSCFYSDQPGCVFVRNQCYGGTYGIQVITGINQIIQNNLISRAYIGIISNTTPTGVLVDNNTVVNCHNTGIYLPGADATSYARNNVLYKCQRGMATHGSINKAKNAYYDNSVYSWGSTAGGGSIDADAITADPQLNLSYMPKTGSPLQASGTFLKYSMDLCKNLYRNPPSIGAYEVSTTRGTR